MRSIAGLLALVVGVVAAMFFYRTYLTQSTGAGTTNPIQTIDVVGVKNDLIGIAQAERTYQAQNSSYGSLDQLVSSGALMMKKTGRDGYTYDVEASAETFRVTAHCPRATNPGCTDYVIDQTMEIRTAR